MGSFKNLRPWTDGIESKTFHVMPTPQDSWQRRAKIGQLHRNYTGKTNVKTSPNATVYDSAPERGDAHHSSGIEYDQDKYCHGAG